MRKNFYLMLLPLLPMLAILVWTAVNNATDWTAVDWAVYSVLVVFAFLFAFWGSLEDANTKVKQLEQLFSFVLLDSFVCAVAFCFLATWTEVRLTLTIMLCSMTVLQFVELAVSPPKKCAVAIYFANAMVCCITAIFVGLYVAIGEWGVVLLLHLMSFCAICMILSLLGYAVRGIWRKFK